MDKVFLYKEESYAIRGAVFNVYKEVGCGFLEAVYQECLAKEFSHLGISYEEQKKLDVFYKGEKLKQSYKPDFICEGKIIVEIKAVSSICDEHRAQLQNYLKITGYRVGFIVNFGHFPKSEIERIVK